MVSANSRLSCSVISSRTGSSNCNGMTLVTVPKGWSSRADWWSRGWAEAFCELLEIGFLGMRFSLNYEFGGNPEEEEIARTEVSAPVLVARLNPFWMPIAGNGCRASLNVRCGLSRQRCAGCSALQ